MMLQQACVGLFLDPGLGKTAIALAAFKLLKKAGYVKRMLVIAPLRPCYSVWPAEISKWANFGDLRYCILHGPDRGDMLDLDADIFIMNVDNTRWLFEEQRWKRIHADVLCVDESTKFKNYAAKTRFQVIKRYLNEFKRRWILSGTPAPNGLMDLFTQIYLLDQGAALGQFITKFRITYFVQSYSGYDWFPMPDALSKITDKIAPLVIRLKAEDYVEMPDLQYINVEVELPSDAREAYRRMEDQFFLKVQEGEVVASNAAVAGGKCRQISNGRVYDIGRAVYDIHTAKLQAFEDLVEELSGQPALVLYEFKHDLEAMRTRVPGPSVGGDTSTKNAEEAIAAFNAGLVPVLYGHPASVGHGLNLQEAAHHVIFYCPTWDLELHDQVIRRVYRQGQKAAKVLVYHIVAKDTLDTTVLEVLHSKDRTQKTLLEAFTNRASLC